MVMTAGLVKQQRATQKKQGKKPEDLARKFMSKADVLKEKEEKLKKAAYLAKQSAEYDAKMGKVTPLSSDGPAVKSTKELLAEDKAKKIAKLTSDKENCKGPGSKARKEAIDKAIEDLEGKE